MGEARAVFSCPFHGLLNCPEDPPASRCSTSLQLLKVVLKRIDSCLIDEREEDGIVLFADEVDVAEGAQHGSFEMIAGLELEERAIVVGAMGLGAEVLFGTGGVETLSYVLSVGGEILRGTYERRLSATPSRRILLDIVRYAFRRTDELAKSLNLGDSRRGVTRFPGVHVGFVGVGFFGELTAGETFGLAAIGDPVGNICHTSLLQLRYSKHSNSFIGVV